MVREILSDLYRRYDVLNLKDDREAKQALFAAGLKRVVPDADKLAEIRAVLQETNADLARRGVVSLELYKEMMGYVEQWREERATIAAAENTNDPQ